MTASQHARGAVHVVGIAGEGMCPLAELLADAGWRVSGSDVTPPARWIWPTAMRRLVERGCQIAVGHDAARVAPDTDLVVYSSLVGPENVELRRARELGIPTVARADMLGRLMEERTAVGVIGGVGKTTTTAMLGTILRATGRDPTVYVGAEILDWDDRNHLWGAGPAFVAELDDSNPGLPVVPYALAVVTNVDYLDHPATFRTMAEAIDLFAALLARARRIVVNGDDPPTLRMAGRLAAPSVTFGLGDGCRWHGRVVEAGPEATRIELHGDGRLVGTGTLRVPGRHNVMNALAAIAGAAELGVDPARSLDTLASFRGAARRLQRLPDVRGRLVYQDYAHNRVQLAAALDGLHQQHPGRRIVCCLATRFRPTSNAHLDGIEDVFREPTTIGIIDPGPRPEYRGDGPPLSVHDLAERFARRGHRARPLAGVDDAVGWLLASSAPGDVLYFFGTHYLARDTVLALGA